MAHQIKCEEIGYEKGAGARKAYEAKFDAAQQKAAELQKVTIENTKNDLLINRGICPYTDPEGIRQMSLLEENIDLSKVPGTKPFVEMTKTKRDSKTGKHAAYRQDQRFVVKSIAEDLRARDVDPLEYFEANKEKTRDILDMSPRKAQNMAEKYKERVEELGGTLSGLPKKGPFVATTVEDTDVNDQTSDKASSKRAAKEAAAKKNAQQKALATKKKADAKAAKAEAQAAKQAAKAAALAREQQLAKAQVETVETNDVVVATTTDMNDADIVDTTATTDMALTTEQEAVTSVVEKKSSRKLSSTIAPIGAVLAVAGGGGYAFKVTKDKADDAEQERQRQFKLIMGMDDDEDDEDVDDDDEDVEDDLDNFTMNKVTEKSTSTVAKKTKDIKSKKETTTPAVEPKIKTKKVRRGGLSSVFSKKNASSRETVLSKLVSPKADAPVFATLLAKLLTYGALGRFPDVNAMDDGSMPLGSTFELDKAKELLIKSREETDLNNEVSAETFASVVNCMLIDIVDLASSSLKEKDDKITINALNVVMDFMDHAASLFDAVADEVTITPVTYGGSLGKKQLEQMFSVYSAAMMTMMGTDSGNAVTQDRVDTLQQVFNINDKRAEGLIQKSMMKGMMSMMKDGGEGGGMEGLSEMMASMGGEGGLPGMEGLAGMEGLEGLGGDGEFSPEELKQSVSMMKELVDSGSVSKEELDMVRQQFKEVYGSDIKDMIKDADGEGGVDDLGEDGQELLDLFKTILKDD